MLKLATAAATAALALTPAAAHAQSIALGVPPDPVEEVPFQLTVTGTALQDHFLYTTIKHAGAAGCGATRESDADSVGVGQVRIAHGGPFTVTQTTSTRNPGSYLLCSWLQAGGRVAAATSAIVNVRSAHATLTVKGPRRITPGRTATFTFTGATELGRDLAATVKPGRTCAGDRGSRFMWANVKSAYSVKRAPTRFDLRFRGAYVLCAWVGEGIPDPAPEAAVTFRFRVETARCARARAALRKASRSQIRHARRAVRRAC